MVKLDINFDRDEALARAANGDYRQLAARLREGKASPQELALAADLILKAPKPAAHRPNSTLERNISIYEFVEDCLAAHPSKEAAVEAATKKFKLSASTIYGILKEIAAARDGRELPRRPRRRRSGK
jgi:hypothetical protein